MGRASALRVLLCAMMAAIAVGAYLAAPSAVADDHVRAFHLRVTDRRLLVVGASYTAGLGAEPPSAGYAYLVGRRLGWPTAVVGAAGTGFLNPGPHHQGTYAQRITRLRGGPPPGLVLLQAGRNDAGYPSPKLRQAVLDTVALLRHRYAGAQVVMLGPIPATAPVGGNLVHADRVLAAAARDCDIPYLDPIREGWINRDNAHGYLGRVPAHPNNAGYAYLARRTVADLQALGIGAEAGHTKNPR